VIRSKAERRVDQRPSVNTRVWLWCARVLWALLPVSTGTAFTDALDGWSTGPARVAAGLLWLAWACGIVALFLPRPWGVTALRVVAPLALVCTLLTITSTTGGVAVLAVTSVVVAVVFALASPVVQAAANALAYGDEVRFALRIPTPLLLGPVPIGLGLIGAGVAAGPLLLADGRIALGIVALVVGLPVAALVVRSLHGLSRRWLVFVPAGVVVADPLSLLDPVLIRRNEVAGLQRVKGVGGTNAPNTLDLRLGTVAGSVALLLRVPQPFARRRGRSDAVIIEASTVVVAVVRAPEALGVAGARRIATG
jgi:hypothetical protein